jgi:hypothetical protein
MRSVSPTAVWSLGLWVLLSGSVPPRATSPEPRGSVASALSPALRAAWVRTVQAEAPASFDWSDAGVARSQGATWEVGASGLSVRADAGWSLRLATRRLGREGALRGVPAPARSVVGNDARLERAGWVERWVHGPLGVEQVLEVAERPAGEGALVVELGVAGLTPSLEGGAVRLADGRGVRASYGELWVEDADGQPVPSELVVVGGAIQLRVDDRVARYPLVIDPLVGIEQARLEAGDGSALDAFGFAVAVRGDTALVGAYRDDSARGLDAGAAYVFVRSGSTWTEQARLEASDGAADDGFGVSVALDGDTAVVGAYQHDTAGGANAGAVYVFVRSGSTWTEQAKLEAADGTAFASLGISVALDGDTLLVGARDGDAVRAPRAGAAYVFTRSAGAWSAQAKLEASDGSDGDAFGVAVGLDGDTALVGANADTTARGISAGSAYVFVRSGAAWTEQARLEAGDGTESDVFGYSVSLSGDTALIGALYDDTPQGINAGSAYVFVRSGTAWTEQARLRPADGAPGDFFGAAVSLAGDVALVGAPRHTTSRGTNAGSAYLLMRRGTAWAEQSRIDARDAAAADLLGTSVALDGETALVGAPFDDTARGVDVGSAYVFRLGPADGEPCAAGAACASGFCVDGVCCDAACGGGAADDCQACSVAAGASADGVCGPTTGNACSDGRACTVVDACAAGVCAGTGSPCLGGTECSASGASFLCAPCPAGTASTDGTGTTACVPCAAGTFAGAGATSCAPWSTCAAGEYESVAPTDSRDRACARCAVCGADEREVAPCGPTSDTVCAASVDAGPAASDAGLDAGLAEPDAGLDAGLVAADAGLDARLPESDAQVDAGAPAPVTPGSCGCAVPGRGRAPGGWLVPTALVGLLVSRRTRRARAS